MKEPTSLGEVINQAVQQDQVTAHSVKEVVCSLVLKICLAWHRFSVKWVMAEVLVDQKKKVQGAVEGLKVRLSANRRLEPARRALWEVMFCVGGVAKRASARIGHDNGAIKWRTKGCGAGVSLKTEKPKLGKPGESRQDVKN